MSGMVRLSAPVTVNWQLLFDSTTALIAKLPVAAALHDGASMARNSANWTAPGPTSRGALTLHRVSPQSNSRFARHRITG